jgi:hypothetical protein
VCKHILFVMLRVLKLSTTNPLAWQKALLTKEVRVLVCVHPVLVVVVVGIQSSVLCCHTMLAAASMGLGAAVRKFERGTALSG